MREDFRLYTPFLVLRRTSFVIFLIIFSFASSRCLLGILIWIQILYICLLLILRPFSTTKSNIIEIFNEWIFFGLLSTLIFLNTEDNWTPTKARAYIWIMWANSFIVLMVILANVGRELIILIRKRLHNKVVSFHNLIIGNWTKN